MREILLGKHLGSNLWCLRELKQPFNLCYMWKQLAQELPFVTKNCLSIINTFWDITVKILGTDMRLLMFLKPLALSMCDIASPIGGDIELSIHYRNNGTAYIQGGSNMTRTDCGLFTHKSVPVIFESPCTSQTNVKWVIFKFLIKNYQWSPSCTRWQKYTPKTASYSAQTPQSTC
jgi:hypothetical protein